MSGPVAPQPPAIPPAVPQPPVGSAFDVSGIQDQIGRYVNIDGDLSIDLFLVQRNRLRLRLRDFESATRARLAWGVPASLGLGFLGMLLTVKGVERIEVFGLNKDSWIGICTTGLVGCALISLGLIGLAIMKWKDGSVEEIVESLRRPEPKA